MKESSLEIFKISLVLLVAVITFAFLYFEKHFSLSFIGIAMLFYLLCFSFHVLAHESGHLIGGLISGYKLLFLQFGPLVIINKKKHLSFTWKCSLNGQCIMMPKQTNLLRFKAYNFGGIFANALIVFLGFTLLLLNSFWADLLFIELMCVGIKKILVNAIPFKSSIPNDGYIIKLLNNNISVQKDYLMFLRLYGKTYFDEDISIQDFVYEREAPADKEEMLFYNEIQKLLNCQSPV